MAFTNLRAGSNFKSNRDSIGQNGVGASLTNVFSKHFTVVTSDQDNCFTMECFDNMLKINHKISKRKKEEQ